MKLTIEPTRHFFMAGDVMVRMWEGLDDRRDPVIVLVTAVAFAGQGQALAEGLVSIPPPSPDDARRWAESIIRQSGATE